MDEDGGLGRQEENEPTKRAMLAVSGQPATHILRIGPYPCQRNLKTCTH